MSVKERLGPSLFVAVELWMRHCTSTDFFIEIAQSALNLSNPRRANFGPFSVSWPAFAAKFSQTVLKRMSTFLILGIATTSRKPLLRNAARRVEYFPVLQQHYFSRLWAARLISWLLKKATPRMLQPIFVNTLDATKHEDGTPREFVTLPDNSTSGVADAVHETMTEQGVREHHRAALNSQGVFRTVLEANLLDYLSSILVEQANWINSYVKTPPSRWRGVFRFHVVGTTTTFVEMVGSLAARTLGAKLFHSISSSGTAAFWGELIFNVVASRFIYYYSTIFGTHLLNKLDKLLPVSDAETAYETEQDEKYREKAQEEAERHRELYTGADDYYKALGLQPSATQEEIKKQYKKLALKLHPDKIGHLPEDQREQAATQFKLINKAHSILSNEDKRREYDEIYVRDETPPKWMYILSGLPIPLKLIATFGILFGGVGAIFSVIYGQMFMMFKLMSAPGFGILRMFTAGA